MSRLHEALKTLSQLVKIKSVEGKPAPGAPFGKENREALDFILATAEKLGFRTFSYGGYYGYAETGDADKPMFGILGHLDVVPVSDGWRYPPFGGEIGEGYLWGRGTLDDKGPMVAALYAVRELLDEARLPKMRIRLIFGCNEESGWRCIEKYSEREEMPAMGFSPDANFPVIYCEKAVSHIDLYVPKPDGIIGFEAGSRVNIVPDSASAAVAEEFCRDILPTPEGVTRNGNVFYATGLSAHGSTPESGDNAALKLMKYLSGFMPEVKTLYELLRYSDGGGMGLKRSEPDYGALSVNTGVISTANGEMRISLDFRHPASVTTREITETLERLSGGKTVVSGTHRPLLVPKDHPLVVKLSEAYRSVTGDDAEPASIGGATFARALPVAVAFGPVFPGDEDNIHRTNERVSIKSFDKTMRIYKAAILKTCF